jgi:hypothetical protein
MVLGKPTAQTSFAVLPLFFKVRKESSSNRNSSEADSPLLASVSPFSAATASYGRPAQWTLRLAKGYFVVLVDTASEALFHPIGCQSVFFFWWSLTGGELDGILSLSQFVHLE